MYVLLNKEGDIITAIPHGQVVRQCNDFDLYICFPYENRFRNLSPFVEFSIKGKFTLAGTIDPENWGNVFTFQKLDKNEAEFEFREGDKYYQYHINVPASSGVTSVYGSVPFIISVVLNHVTRQGKSTLNVAKTYGLDDKNGITKDNMDAIMKTLMMATNLYTFSGESYDPAVAQVDGLYIYSWKALAFVRGFVTLNAPVTSIEATGIEALEPYEDDYAIVAQFYDCVDVTVPAVMFGHSESGEDVEFKIVGDGSEEDGIGDAYLLVNRNSDIGINDKIAIVGTFMAKRVDTENYDAEADFTITTSNIEDGAVTREKLGEDIDVLTKKVVVNTESITSVEGLVRAAHDALCATTDYDHITTAYAIGDFGGKRYTFHQAYRSQNDAIYLMFIAQGADSDFYLAYVNDSLVKIEDWVTASTVDGSITTAKLGDGIVTTAKLADQSVNTFKLGDGSVQTAKISNLAVTGDKIANDTITSNKIVVDKENSVHNIGSYGDGLVSVLNAARAYFATTPSLRFATGYFRSEFEFMVKGANENEIFLFNNQGNHLASYESDSWSVTDFDDIPDGSITAAKIASASIGNGLSLSSESLSVDTDVVALRGDLTEYVRSIVGKNIYKSAYWNLPHSWEAKLVNPTEANKVSWDDFKTALGITDLPGYSFIVRIANETPFGGNNYYTKAYLVRYVGVSSSNYAQAEDIFNAELYYNNDGIYKLNLNHNNNVMTGTDIYRVDFECFETVSDDTDLSQIQSDISTLSSTKANSSDVESALALKADKSDLKEYVKSIVGMNIDMGEYWKMPEVWHDRLFNTGYPDGWDWDEFLAAIGMSGNEEYNAYVVYIAYGNPFGGQNYNTKPYLVRKRILSGMPNNPRAVGYDFLNSELYYNYKGVYSFALATSTIYMQGTSVSKVERTVFDRVADDTDPIADTSATFEMSYANFATYISSQGYMPFSLAVVSRDLNGSSMLAHFTFNLMYDGEVVGQVLAHCVKCENGTENISGTDYAYATYTGTFYDINTLTSMSVQVKISEYLGACECYLSKTSSSYFDQARAGAIVVPFDDAVQYSEGALVLREGGMYKANTTTTSGDFYSDEWDEVHLEEAIDSRIHKTSSIAQNSTDLITSGGVYPLSQAIDDVVNTTIPAIRAVAEGKTKAYAISNDVTGSGYANSLFQSSNDEITVSYVEGSLDVSQTSIIRTVDSISVDIGSMRLGDVVFVTQTDVPDRWVSSLSKSGSTVTAKFSKLETVKVTVPTNYVTIDTAQTITGNKTFSGSVTLPSSCVDTAQIVASSIVTEKISGGAVTEAKIGTGAVTTAKIYDGAVTTEKIATGAVNTAKIANGAITPAKVTDAVDYAVHTSSYSGSTIDGFCEEVFNYFSLEDHTFFMVGYVVGAMQLAIYNGNAGNLIILSGAGLKHAVRQVDTTWVITSI